MSPVVRGYILPVKQERHFHLHVMFVINPFHQQPTLIGLRMSIRLGDWLVTFNLFCFFFFVLVRRISCITLSLRNIDVYHATEIDGKCRSYLKYGCAHEKMLEILKFNSLRDD